MNSDYLTRYFLFIVLDMYLVQGAMLLQLVSRMCCGEEMIYKTNSNARLCQHDVKIRKVTQHGMATEFLRHCKSNPEHQQTIFSCPRVEDGPSQAYRTNIMLVLASMFKGEKYDGMMNTLAAYGIGTMEYRSYATIREKVQKVVSGLAKSSRSKWLEMIVSSVGTSIDVELDGTWSKRYGHNALFGFVFALHPQTNKIIGVASNSRFFHTCNWHKTNRSNVLEHLCEKNWNQSAGAMEKDGFRRIACELLEDHDIRYSILIQ